MSYFFLETLMLNTPSVTNPNTLEWDCSSLVADNATLSALSMDFFFSFFNYFNFTTLQTPWTSAVLANSSSTDAIFFMLGSNSLWSVVASFGSGVSGELATSSSFSYMLGLLFFPETSFLELYAGTEASDFSFRPAGFTTGALANVIAVSSQWMNALACSVDWGVIVAELGCLALVLSSIANFTNFSTSVRTFYDDTVTFCQTNNLSFGEIAVFFTVCLGFIIFDIFASAVEEDITDVFFYFMLAFVTLLFVFLVASVDVQYFYMISSTSAGDLTASVVIFDVINNFLCVLRIFFCWVRYIFYDLQVEFVDFSFHYTDAINDLNAAGVFAASNGGAWSQGNLASQNNLPMLASFRAFFWVFIVFFIDISFVILQILLSFAKLFIAFFLLWLIVDLFILKALSISESSNLSRLSSKL